MEYKAYPRRWLLLVILCGITFIPVYITNGFVVLHDVVASFYDITPYQADMLAVVGQLFYVTALGRIIMAFINGVTRTAQVLLAAAWFPQNETATAFVLPVFAKTLAGIISSLIYPYAIPNVDFPVDGSGTEFIPVKILFTATHGFFSIVLLIALVLAVLYCDNDPPSPPNRSQENILISVANSPKTTTQRSRLKAVWNAIYLKPFILLSLAMFFGDVAQSYAVFLMPSFVLSSFPELDNRIPGDISTIRASVTSLIVIVTGRILDKYKSFKMVSIIGATTAILSFCCLYYAHTYKILPLIYIGYTAALSSRCIYGPAIVEFLMETTYPNDKLRMMPVFGGITSLGLFFWTSIMRILKENFDIGIATIAAICISVALVLFILSVEPDYKRLKTNKFEESPAKLDETTAMNK
uniref:feline leukemia virus subgroup C receptor-related protein 2-like n=1 Tax=Styela clava TaxID=7725 RepID=UPI00193AC437|nr:feline leukemia virus subgroup C receptor-related protein 2-like [Styela clava]